MNKGEYNLNPTDAVMKSGSEKYRSAVAGEAKHFPKAGRYTEQRSELESEVHSADHPMMKTRQSHAAEKHADGRKNEDHHHAVRQLKGY